ncbi:MAG: hypothetical protein ACRCYU_20675 [Nocardioides sp.]
MYDYVEAFYNPSRIQRRLGYHSPTDPTTTVAKNRVHQTGQDQPSRGHSSAASTP